MHTRENHECQAGAAGAPRRLPPWLKRKLPAGGHGAEVRALLDRLGLSTVCQSAHCPNQCECFARRTATFLIMGPTCTRTCGFCAVRHGPPEPLRSDEPQAVAQAAAQLQLRHVVITCVTRDDLADGGAGHFARTIAAVRQALPRATVEVLTSDFAGRLDSLDVVLAARPDVFNHNVETVERLTPLVRPQADYRRSLRVLEHAGRIVDCGMRIDDLNAPTSGATLKASCALGVRDGQSPPSPNCGLEGGTGRPSKSASRNPQSAIVKSGLMVGLGETDDEVRATMLDLRRAGVQALTIGQYLAPSKDHLPVARFVTPQQFDLLREEALAMGFLAVQAGPFVRSSYNAETMLGQRE